MTRAIVGIAVSASMVAGLLFSIVFADPTGALFFLAFGGVGAYLVVRRPANSIGWLLVLTAWGLAIGSVRVNTTPAALSAGDLDTATALATWSNAWGWTLAFVGFLGLTLVFPTGHMPGGRARWPSRIAFGVEVALCVAMATAPIISVTPVGSTGALDVPNPFAILPEAAFWAIVPAPTYLFVTMFVVFIFGVVGLLIRWRRSVGLARLQYRWLVAAIVLVVIANSIWAVATLGLSMDSNGPAFLLVVLTYPCVPLAIGIAVVRYRLYEIDRIISRTIGWALVTGPARRGLRRSASSVCRHCLASSPRARRSRSPPRRWWPSRSSSRSVGASSAPWIVGSTEHATTGNGPPRRSPSGCGTRSTWRRWRPSSSETATPRSARRSRHSGSGSTHDARGHALVRCPPPSDRPASRARARPCDQHDRDHRRDGGPPR